MRLLVSDPRSGTAWSLLLYNKSQVLLRLLFIKIDISIEVQICRTIWKRQITEEKSREESSYPLPPINLLLWTEVWRYGWTLSCNTLSLWFDHSVEAFHEKLKKRCIICLRQSFQHVHKLLHKFPLVRLGGGTSVCLCYVTNPASSLHKSTQAYTYVCFELYFKSRVPAHMCQTHLDVNLQAHLNSNCISLLGGRVFSRKTWSREHLKYSDSLQDNFAGRQSLLILGYSEITSQMFYNLCDSTSVSGERPSIQDILAAWTHLNTKITT